MLEAIRDRAQGIFAKIILALIIVPFALWGVDSYIHNKGEADVIASVNGQKILSQEFSQALKDQQERLRTKLGGSFDPALLDSPEVRQSVLDNLINQHLLVQEASKIGVAITDAQLASVIAQIPAFQQDGQFQKERYDALLRNQNMTPSMFESRVRQELMSQQLIGGLTASQFMSHTVVEAVMKASEQQREASVHVVKPEQFLSKIKIEPAAVKSYYDSHLADFKVPEQVRAEYVVLSADALLSQVQVSDEEVKNYFLSHSKQYQTVEERQAAHILISVAPDATAAEKTAANKKANQVLKEVNSHPADFAELAKKYSQDSGSAAQGGDLGMFGRGAMVKPFEEAAFKMTVGEITGPVKSDFGLHIIKLTAIKPAKSRALDEVKGEIVSELKKQKASKKFAEVADNFSNIVYEQGDSLKPAADALKLTVQTSGWVSRTSGDGAGLNNEKVLQALFSDEILNNKRNTEAIEVASNTLVSARVIDHKAASTKPFDQVSSAIAERLQNEQAVVMAKEQGETMLAQLRQGKSVALAWDASKTITRQNAQGLDEAALIQVFKANAHKLPAYAGVENPHGGFTLLKISKVTDATGIDEAKRKAYAQGLSELVASEQTAVYLASLKKQAEIKVMKEKLVKAER
ncbi:SurA N-terminal domain-containing protein [Sulfurirhabdus autotrophica]|uniref:Periplasmic chaperone PpiD n=1 Tax=Sulfurirhabdus autotrophica TaxID=1706046 RepID=A0A4R3Y6D1_9PROT|nr:SurA N-terminal domain-containing protein [Sulfurirhabdus autotrophica]TCV87360.1 peptidyl-prolyl cis-trans isomerase D [Sulfurirhabdus autotrophica]